MQLDRSLLFSVTLTGLLAAGEILAEGRPVKDERAKPHETTSVPEFVTPQASQLLNESDLSQLHKKRVPPETVRHQLALPRPTPILRPRPILRPTLIRKRGLYRSTR